MPKRIPKQSAILGMSSKQYVRLINSLPDAVVSEIVQSLLRNDKYAAYYEQWIETLMTTEAYAFVPQPPLVGVELNPGPVGEPTFLDTFTGYFHNELPVPVVKRPTHSGLLPRHVISANKGLTLHKDPAGDYTVLAGPYTATSGPKMPLVGVETNPGPKFAEVVKVPSVAKFTGRKSKNRKPKSASKMNATGNVRLSGLVSAPVQESTIGRNIRRNRTQIIPFNSDSMFLTQGGASTPFVNALCLANQGDSIASSSVCLNPISAVQGDSNAWKIFGPEASTLATIYTRWRIRSLLVKFNSSSGSNTPGHFAVCYRPDCATGTLPSQQNYGRVSSTYQAVDGPLYNAGRLVTLVPANLDTSWKYIQTIGGSMADMHLSSAGCLCVSGFGLNASSNVVQYGVMEISGELEFSTFQDNTDVPAPVASTSFLGTDPLSSDSTTAAPFGTVLPIALNTNQYAANGKHIIIKAPGVYQILGSWASTTGTITTGGTATLTGGFSPVAIVNSFSTDPLSNYSFALQILAPTDPSSSTIAYPSPLTIDFTGPTGMLTGIASVSIQCIQRLL